MPASALETFILHGSKVTVEWDADFEEFVATLTDANGIEIADGNGETVEEAVGNCEANTDEHLRWTTPQAG